MGKKQHLYERKSHQTKMADFILQGVRLRQKQYLAGEAGEEMFNPTLMNKLIRIE